MYTAYIRFKTLMFALIPKNAKKNPPPKKKTPDNVLLNTPKHNYDANINLLNRTTNIDLLFYQLYVSLPLE